MNDRTLHVLPLLLLAGASLLLTNCYRQHSTAASGEGAALFVHEIQPIIQRKCLSCHGREADIRGEFDMRSRKALLRGGVSGLAAIVPGKPELSPLIHAIKRIDPDLAMPPKDNERLEPDEIELFEDWIALGAAWPDDAQQQEIITAGDWQYGNRITVRTSGGQSEAWDNRRYKMADLWAFLPLQQPEIPTSGGSPKLNPVDAFIQHSLEEQGLSPAEPADKRTLIRRVTFDLTGLPPSPAEVAAFLQDEEPEAFTRVVDRLLASPHYGEQWGRHWLDVVRYADSDGYSNDYIRPNTWRYRDYVIRAFNEDKPYDQFVREQLAGDEIDPDDPEMLIATGFLRMGPWEHTAMSIAAETRQLFLDDVTNIVGETFLSLPLGCAKCHDHKYDPIPTRDYYAIQAVFAPTQFADRPAAFLAGENLDLLPEEKQRVVEWIDKTKAEEVAMVAKEENAARAWFRTHGKAYLSKKERRQLPDEEQPPRYYGLTNQDLGYRKVLNKRLQSLNRTKNRFDPLAYSVYNGPNRVVQSHQAMTVPEELLGEPPATFVLAGGSVYAPQEEVRAGILSAPVTLATATDNARPAAIPNPVPQGMNGRRKAFAEWLSQANQPLAARSIVNRVWQYHFGRGLAENANNFGATGRKPSHPELLDWLVHYFVDHGQSLKALHRLILLSAAYQRGSQHPQPEQLALIDPDNHYLAVYTPRRLGAEEIRDAMLQCSGELNLELGGLPVRPEINWEIALQPRHTMGSIAQAYQPSRRPDQRNRRTIYAERYRNLPNPMLEVFNQPSPDLSCERRATSTVTPQVFSLLNSPQIRDRAIALAVRLQQEAPKDAPSQIRRAAELLWNRPASDAEIDRSLQYLAEMTNYHQENQAVPVIYPTEVEREMFEEMTGESFSYVEELDIYRDYVPDLKDADVPPQTRALADVVMVLFNTNEFIYVY